MLGVADWRKKRKAEEGNGKGRAGDLQVRLINVDEEGA